MHDQKGIKQGQRESEWLGSARTQETRPWVERTYGNTETKWHKDRDQTRPAGREDKRRERQRQEWNKLRGQTDGQRDSRKADTQEQRPERRAKIDKLTYFMLKRGYLWQFCVEGQTETERGGHRKRTEREMREREREREREGERERWHRERERTHRGERVLQRTRKSALVHICYRGSPLNNQGYSPCSGINHYLLHWERYQFHTTLFANEISVFLEQKKRTI